MDGFRGAVNPARLHPNGTTDGFPLNESSGADSNDWADVARDCAEPINPEYAPL